MEAFFLPQFVAGASVCIADPLTSVIFQKNKRKKAGTVDFKNHPSRKDPGRWGQGPGSVDLRFPAGLPLPEILEFVAFRDLGKMFQQCCRDTPGVFSGTPEQTPETATAFSSFLNFSFKITPDLWKFHC